MKIPVHPLKFPYHTFRRWLSHPVCFVLFFLSPLLNILRVDTINWQFIWLGQVQSLDTPDLGWLPIGFYALVLLIAVVSFVWGRLFCGWSCPHNILTENTRALRSMVGREPYPSWLKRVLNQKPKLKPWMPWLSLTIGTGLAFFLAFALCAYVVPPDWMIAQYLSGHAHPALTTMTGLLVLIGLFALYAGHDFCRVCCPYGMSQSISAFPEGLKMHSMTIAYQGDSDYDDCQSCQACQRICPVDIDPRAGNLKVGVFKGCFNCGECIDACKVVTGHRGKNEALLRFNQLWQGREKPPETVEKTVP